MKEALRLAKKGTGKTYPNPLVGAVLVKNSKIIGKGYYKRAGGPHAEIKAINSATETAQGSALYVTLEPHGYTAKTPPCTDAIIAAGISRVVCSTLDPNPKVQGDGIEQLKKAGIAVSVGLMEVEAKLLNEQFFVFHQKNRPFIAVKYAASLDGKLAAAGDSKWITNEPARAYGRKLRGRYQAILVGVNTVLADDPHLGTRRSTQPDPLRIILDSELRTPLRSQVLRNNNVLIATTTKASMAKRKQLLASGCKVIAFEGSRVPLDELMQKLKEMNIISVLVEGGGKVIGDFNDNRLVDRIYGFYAPILIGGNGTSIRSSGAQTVSEASAIKKPHIRWFGNNFLIEGTTI